MLRERGIPRKYTRARLSDFDAQDLVEANEDGLFITGSTGTGKTHLATAWLIDALPGSVQYDEIRERVVVRRMTWTTVPEVLGQLRGTFGDRGAGSEQSVISQYGEAALLVLDDLGAEQVTDWTGQALYRLICRRINDCLPTIVTSNLSLDELNKRDPRLASRLGGMAYQRLKGEDRRLMCHTRSKT